MDDSRRIKPHAICFSILRTQPCVTTPNILRRCQGIAIKRIKALAAPFEQHPGRGRKRCMRSSCLRGPTNKGPKNHINIRIRLLGHAGPYKGDSKKTLFVGSLCLCGCLAPNLKVRCSFERQLAFPKGLCPAVHSKLSAGPFAETASVSRRFSRFSQATRLPARRMRSTQAATSSIRRRAPLAAEVGLALHPQALHRATRRVTSCELQETFEGGPGDRLSLARPACPEVVLLPKVCGPVTSVT